MATYTPNLNLKKPAGSDYVLVGDFNGNSDTLDSVIGKPSQLETVERTNLVLAINEAMKRGGENGPYIDSVTETWWVWDGATFQYIDTGYPATGLPAGFDTPTAQAEALPEGQEPTVSVTASGPDTAKMFAFQFGIPKGDTGEAAGFGTPTATTETLPPDQDATVNVTATGPNTAKVFDFRFGIPKGDTGENAEIVNVTASVDNTSGNPQVVASMGGTPQARTFDFAFSGLRGVDGEGAVVSVNGELPDASGNVTLAPFSASGSTAASGLVPAPSTTAGTTKYLREDATWVVPPNTTYSSFVKSGSTAASGLVPAPSTTAGTTKYLREDATWAVPPNTTYSAATTSTDGLMSSTDKTKLNGIATGATKNTISSTTATLLASAWSNKSLTVSVTGVTATNNIVVSPNAASWVAWGTALVRAVSQATGSITFACNKVPADDLVANILIVG